MNKYTSSNSSIATTLMFLFHEIQAPIDLLWVEEGMDAKECCGNGFVVEYNRGRLGRGQLHVLIALARGSGCMMHTILGGLLNTCVLLTMFYSCPAIWLNAALSNSSICMCLLDHDLFVYSLGCPACLLASLISFVYLVLCLFCLLLTNGICKKMRNPCR